MITDGMKKENIELKYFLLANHLKTQEQDSLIFVVQLFIFAQSSKNIEMWN